MQPGKSAAWHIITSEYPPQVGGVSDYTQLIAHGLAGAGDEVHVWCPTEERRPEVRGQKSEVRSQVQRSDSEGGDQRPDGTLIVHRELGRFTRSDFRRFGDKLNQFESPRRLLVQWVPHGYGKHSMNLQFCLWLRDRSNRGDEIELMVHEPYLAFWEGSWKQNAVAVVHRLMTMILLRAASRVWISIPAWEQMLRPYAFGRDLEIRWLPVSSTVPVVGDRTSIARARALYTRGPHESLIGHFGTYSPSIAKQLKGTLAHVLMREPSAYALLLGLGGDAVRKDILKNNPLLDGRVFATGLLKAHDLSSHLAACDLVFQPFPDGVTTRRTSVMASLAHGLPVLTNQGHLTEEIWSKSGAVALSPVGTDIALSENISHLLASDAERARLGSVAQSFYREHFDIARTIASLRAL